MGLCLSANAQLVTSNFEGGSDENYLQSEDNKTLLTLVTFTMHLINKLSPLFFFSCPLLFPPMNTMPRLSPRLCTLCTRIIDVNENCNLDKWTYRAAIVIESYVYIRAIRIRFFSLFCVFLFYLAFFFAGGDVLQVRPYQTFFSRESAGCSFHIPFFFSLCILTTRVHGELLKMYCQMTPRFDLNAFV